ncbi:hypothetical protein COO91_09779 (plasmid) [Nostoc flagelliforme CCNUN1]|uniref:Uncharacterized protein n=1 Tax=Nostoc flagelliforme CCNUN1 TaxID=2038116 RepID=A0A2K8T7C1_9NOSO|nr:hypothetical protein COO91_09779 [Nostoc flagelliforme CCNUN1]
MLAKPPALTTEYFYTVDVMMFKMDGRQRLVDLLCADWLGLSMLLNVKEKYNKNK